MDNIEETELAGGHVVDNASDVAEPDEIDRDVDSLDEPVRELIDRILEEGGDTLRLVARYDRGDYEVVYARDDVTEGFSEPELTTRVETFVMQGMGEPEREGTLYDFGELDATVRWYDEAVVAHVPVSEWTGLVFTFDRTTESLAALASQFF